MKLSKYSVIVVKEFYSSLYFCENSVVLLIMTESLPIKSRIARLSNEN